METDAVIRYIRELSELSGRLRYAAQKRILIEIALIRLCRPQMETDTQSLLDRIRALEQRVEAGISVQPSQRPPPEHTAREAPAGAAAGQEKLPGAPEGHS